jgi:hypothetical protein
MDGDDSIKALAEAVDNWLAPGQSLTPLAVTLNGGWGGSLTVYRFGPLVVLAAAVTKASWAAAEIAAYTPAGYRPGPGTHYGFLMGPNNTAAVPVFVSAAGQVSPALASSVAGGFTGVLVYLAAAGTLRDRLEDREDGPEIDNQLPETEAEEEEQQG